MSPIKVLHGRPSPEELAAVLAVVSARAAASVARDSEDGPVSEWNAKVRGLRRPQHPGPHAWRTSGWAH